MNKYINVWINVAKYVLGWTSAIITITSNYLVDTYCVLEACDG